MSGSGDQAYDLDLAAATLTGDTHDVGILLQALSAQLAETFPDSVKVTREGGLFHKSDKVKAVSVELGSDLFSAEVAKGRVSCAVGHSSGGIRIRTDRVEMDEWVRRLLGALQAEAAHSTNARQALENIIIGGP